MAVVIAHEVTQPSSILGCGRMGRAEGGCSFRCAHRQVMAFTFSYRNKMKIGCVIPAHNEETRIAAVLDAAVGSSLFSRIVVSDDGSEDGTAQSVQAFPGIELLRLPRCGKSAAVARALPKLLWSIDTVCLLDADLEGLTPTDLEALVRPVRDREVDVSISSRRSYGVFRMELDVLSGERVLPIGMLLGCHLELCPSMGMEVAINRAIIGARCSIRVVPWPGVRNPTKSTKRGLMAGIKEDLSMVKEVHRNGIGTLIRQRYQMGRLLAHVERTRSDAKNG